jgi:hypothetical protein
MNEKDNPHLADESSFEKPSKFNFAIKLQKDSKIKEMFFGKPQQAQVVTGGEKLEQATNLMLEALDAYTSILPAKEDQQGMENKILRAIKASFVSFVEQNRNHFAQSLEKHPNAVNAAELADRLTSILVAEKTKSHSSAHSR